MAHSDQQKQHRKTNGIPGQYALGEPQLEECLSPSSPRTRLDQKSGTSHISNSTFSTRMHFSFRLSTFLLLSLALSIQACEAPADADYAASPTFWCSMSTRITISSGCNVRVDETIVIPWSNGTIARFIPKQPNQQIKDISAGLLMKLRMVETSFEKKDSLSINNDLVHISTNTSREELIVLLSYVIVGGVTTFIPCDFGLFNSELSNQKSTVMLTKWTPGGLSITKIEKINVEFVLVESSLVKYLDHAIHAPGDFRPLVRVRNETTKVEVVYSGLAGNFKPSTLLFYIRLMLTNGGVSCPGLRSCVSEYDIIKEIPDSRLKIVVIVALAVGGVTLVAVVLVLLRYCSKKRKEDDKSGEQMELPKSFQHFAFDTGDEQLDDRRMRFINGGPNTPPSVEKTASIYALDLSPRQAKKAEEE